jgi:hypothetical protein
VVPKALRDSQKLRAIRAMSLRIEQDYPSGRTLYTAAAAPIAGGGDQSAMPNRLRMKIVTLPGNSDPLLNSWYPRRE